jgi:hypothetical protein
MRVAAFWVRAVWRQPSRATMPVSPLKLNAVPRAVARNHSNVRLACDQRLDDPKAEPRLPPVTRTRRPSRLLTAFSLGDEFRHDFRHSISTA